MGRFSLGRRAGLLLPLSCVRNARGDMACYTDAGDVARFLRAAGCTLWQLLPLNELTGGSESPYGANSSHALEPVYIDLAACEDVGALGPEEEQGLAEAREKDRVDFALIRGVKRAALARGWVRFRDRELRKGSARAAAFARFRESKQGWLADYTLYRALHDESQVSWRDWEPGLRDREPDALECARRGNGDVIDRLAWMQWIAYEQWRRGRADANALGVKVVGDLPFMVAGDSADVWGLQRFFRFDATVGVPPDAYSAEGQDGRRPISYPPRNPRNGRKASASCGSSAPAPTCWLRTWARCPTSCGPRSRNRAFPAPRCCAGRSTRACRATRAGFRPPRSA